MPKSTGVSIDAASILQDGWLARMRQDHLGVRDAMTLLQVELNLPTVDFKNQIFAEQLRHNLEMRSQSELKFVLDALILRASILRSLRQTEESEKLLEVLAPYILSLSVATTERNALVANLSREKGLNAYSQGQFVAALEYFWAQGQYSNTLLEKYQANMNCLLSAQSAGIRYEDILHRTEQLLRDLNSANIALSDHDLGAYRAFEFGHKFSQGQFDDLFSADLSTPQTEYLQYLRSWTQMLPWHRFFQKKVCSNFTSLHLRDIRINTLLGRTTPEDLETIPASEVVIRVYSWVWRWLINPTTFDVGKIYQTLSAKRLLNAQLSITENLMLKSSLEWLSLFDSGNSRKLRTMANRYIDTSDSQDLVFHRELRLIRLLKSKKDRDNDSNSDLHIMNSEMEAQTVCHDSVLFEQMELALSNESYRVTFINSYPWLADFLNRNSLSKDRSESSQRVGTINSSVRVDLGMGTVQVLSAHIVDRNQNCPLKSSQEHVEKTLTHSRSLVIGIALLHENSVVSKSDFVMSVWGFSNYEASIHDSKIYNLIARMRKILGSQINLGVKQANVYAHGSWRHVEILGSLAYCLELNRQTTSPLLISDGANHATVPTLRFKESSVKLREHFVNSDTRTITRKHLQEILGLPRSSANRFLEKFISTKILRPVGNGPSRRYEYQENLVRY